MTKSPDPAAVAAAIKEAARTEALARFQKLQSYEISEKSPSDLVTIADLETERALNRDLSFLWPGSVMVGGRGGRGKSGPSGGLAGRGGLLADRSHRRHHQFCRRGAVVRYLGRPDYSGRGGWRLGL
jgi:hypothetical protein